MVQEPLVLAQLSSVPVIEPPPPDAAKLAAASSRLGEQLGRELFTADLAVLKAKGDVKVNQANVLKK